MKDFIYKVMEPILLEHMPENICEIGTHKGASASQMIKTLAPELAKLDKSLYYTGYDIFDYAIDNSEFNKVEKNGKNGAAYARTNQILKKFTKRFKNFNYELHQGFTNETLTSPKKFDFVYIDGGHSYETVKHDYSMVKDSKVIIFDDCNLKPVKDFVDELIEQGIEVSWLETPSKHLWAMIINK